MARRVAAQRRGLLYGLIAAIFVAVIMTVLLFLQINELKNLYARVDPTPDVRAEKVQADIRRAQEDLEAAGVLPAEGGMGLVPGIEAMLERCDNYRAAMGELAYAISGQSLEEVHGEALIGQVRDQKQAGLSAIGKATKALQVAPQAGVEGTEVRQPANLTAAIDQLDIHVQKLTTAYKNKVDTISSLESENQNVKQSLQNTKSELQANWDKMKEETDQRIADLEKELQNVQAQADQFEKEREAAREAANKAEAEAAKKIQDLNNKIEMLNVEVAELTSRIQRALAREFEPDGRIIKLPPGERTGYVNLGSGDGVFNGLTFSVFDPTELGKEAPEPKGSIRLTSVMNEASEFYINTYRKNSPIVEGDVITNPAFDRQRPFRFAVFGFFDIDDDGLDDSSLIKDRIREFGGKIQDQVTVQTDYLVTGQDPMKKVRMPAAGGMSQQQQVAFDKAKQEQKAFGRATDLARRLHIPVLTQNRFISLVGWW